jgi:hypothetical protein
MEPGAACSGGVTEQGNEGAPLSLPQQQ